VANYPPVACSKKRRLLADYRAALARYSEGVTHLSFTFDRLASPEEFHSRWNDLETVRARFESLSEDLIHHFTEHGC
jgi:hypothetical protein